MRKSLLTFLVSFITVLSFGQDTFSTIDTITCDTYTAPNMQIYTSSGTYMATIPNVNMADSIITINLTVKNSTLSSITETSCAPYLAPDGQFYMETGVYTAIIPNAVGCDSTITIDFTTTNETLDEMETACESFTNEHGVVYTATGIYTYYRAGNGCDTIITLDLTILNNSTHSLIEELVCMAYMAPDGQELTESGVYEITIPNAAGCDSIITIDLTVTVPTMSSITESACVEYTAPDGEVYTTSGVKTAIIPNAAGCDSTITINLTINNHKTNTITVSSCGTYTAPDGQTYTTSGIRTAMIPSAAGCDSTITINLTVNPIVNASTTIQGDSSITALPIDMSYQWINCSDNSIIVSATNQILEPMSGSYAVIVTNSAGCSDTSTCVNISNTANLNENDLNGLISIFPNPSSDFITISLPENNSFEILISDVNGKLIQEISTYKNSEMISVSNLESGIYMISFQSESGKTIKRFVKN
jgi:hypothetical protein